MKINFKKITFILLSVFFIACSSSEDEMGGENGGDGDGGNASGNFCDLEFKANVVQRFFSVSHVTNYETQFENYSITPLEVNNMRAGNAAYPGRRVGQLNGNEGEFDNPLPGSYDVSSVDDQSCRVVKRFIFPGFYIVDHNLKLNDNITRLDLVKNDIFMNDSGTLLTIGGRWNDRFDPVDDPLISNDVVLRPQITIVDFSENFFDPGFQVYNPRDLADVSLQIPIGGELEDFRPNFGANGSITKDVTRSEIFEPNEEILAQKFQIAIKFVDVKLRNSFGAGPEQTLNGEILITWVGTETPPQEINPIGD